MEFFSFQHHKHSAHNKESMRGRERAVTTMCYVTALNHLDSVTTAEQSPQEEWVYFSAILENYLICAQGLAGAAVIRSANEFEHSYSALTKSLLVFVDDCLTGVSNQVPSRRLDVITATLGLIWNMIDKTVLIPMFIKLKCVERTIQWIRTDIFASHIKSMGSSIFSIVHNLSRERKGLKQLREKKMFDVLMEQKQLVLDGEDEELRKHFGRTLIALAIGHKQTEENIKLIVDTSTNLFESCMTAGQDSKLQHDGYHVSELLGLLYRAFSNSFVRNTILQMQIDDQLTATHAFAKLFLSLYGVLLDPEPDELEKLAVKYLLRILLRITRYPEYLKELKDNIQFCVIIKSLKNRGKEDEAWHNWYRIKQNISHNKPKEDNTPRVYVSYDSADEEFCKGFIKELRKRITVPISADYEDEESSDETWDSATVIIVLMSTAYGDSSDELLEISDNISTNKSSSDQQSLIVVEAEPNFQCNQDWMRNLLQDKTWIIHDNNIGSMADEVCMHIVDSNMSLVRYVTCSIKNIRRKIANSRENISKPVSTINSTPSTTTAYIVNESLNMPDNSRVFLATKNQDSYSVVCGLDMQTRPTSSSTWV